MVELFYAAKACGELEGAVPPRYKRPFYIATRILMALFAGVLAIVFEAPSAFAAFYLGQRAAGHGAAWPRESSYNCLPRRRRFPELGPRMAVTGRYDAAEPWPQADLFAQSSQSHEGALWSPAEEPFRQAPRQVAELDSLCPS